MKKRVLLNIIPLCFLLCLPLFGLSTSVAQEEFVSPVVASLPSHAPILITHNDNFTDQGWPGSGTVGEPFVIEGYSFNDDVCINVTDTDVHFEIRNCTFESLTSLMGYGVNLDNVSHVTIERCIFTGFDRGVYGQYLDDVIVDSLSLSTNEIGLHFWISEHVTITNITTNDNVEGFSIRESYDISIIGCTTSNNDEYGLYVLNCEDVIIQDYLGFSDGWASIWIEHSDNVLLQDSICGASNWGAEIDNGFNITVMNNTFHHSVFHGISLLKTINCSVHGNLIYLNGQSGYNGYGIMITSSLTDEDEMAFNNTVYGNIMGGNPLGNAYDMANDTTWDDGISLGNTWSDYDGTGVYEVPSEFGLVDSYPSVLSPTHIDTSPDDLTFKYQTEDHSLTWDFITDYPLSYEVFRNETSIKNGTWDGSTLNINIDGLQVGDYCYDIFTYDIFGNNATDRVLVHVLEIDGPTIQVYQYPQYPTNINPITFSVSVTDENGVESVILSYSLNDGEWTNVTIDPQETTLWNVTVPAQAIGTQFAYKIYAVDSLGNWAVSPEVSFTVTQALDPTVLYLTAGTLGIVVLVIVIAKRR